MNVMTTVLNNRYVIQEMIGQGTMGVVFRAYDRLQQDVVAVKRIHVAVDSLQLSAHLDGKTNLLALTREFSILASLRHPHVISVLDYGIETGQHPYFVMKHIEDAKNLYDACKPLAINGKVTLLIQMFEALAYLHERGILHRDLKMDNVLVANNIVRVLDFGLSVERAQAQGRTGSMAYMAPETLQSSVSTIASDLYSAGVMAFEIFANTLPFAPDDVVGILSKPANLSQLDVPPAIANVVGRLLLKDPEDRYESAEAVIIALQKATQRPVTHKSETIRYRRHMLKTTFVGRDNELDTLQQALMDLHEGNGSFWLIGGESGIGKTRLLAELRTYALVNGVQVFSGEINQGANFPHQLWRKIIPQLAITVKLTPQEIAILDEIVPISHLNGHKNVTIPKAGGDAAQQRLLATMNAAIGRLDRPTVLFLENLHWAQESEEILQQVAFLVERQPLTVIGTYRTEETPNLPEVYPTAQTLVLEPLGDMAIKELVGTILGNDLHLLSLLNLIQQEAGGNPLNILEILRVLTQEANKSDDPMSTVAFSVFTQGIEQMITARLEDTPTHLQPMLRLATVLGHNINVAFLELHFPPEAVHEWLMAATDAGILSVMDNQWFFAHDKIRQASLSILSDEDRQHAHHLAAQAYEKTHGDDPVYAPFLLEHWRGAKDFKRAFHYAQIAAKFTFEHGLSQPAKVFASQALELTDESTDSHDIIGMCLLLADVYTRIASYDDALDLYDIIQGMALEQNDLKTQATILAKMGWILLRRQNAKIAREHCQQAVEIAQQIKDPISLSLALKNLGIIALRSGDFDDAVQYLNRSLILVREIDSRQEIATILNALGLTYMAQGFYRVASEYFAESLDYFEALDDRWNIAVALHNYGACMASMGDYDLAGAKVQRALELDRSINDVIGVAYHLSYLMYIALHRENFAEAQHYLVELERILRDTSDNTLKGAMARAAGWLYLYQGDFDKCEQYFDQALKINEELEHKPSALVCRTGYGWLWLLQAEWEKALKVFDNNISETYALNENWTAAEIRNGQAFALLMLDKRGKILDYIKESIKISQVMDAIPLYHESIATYALSIAKSEPHEAAILCYFVMNQPSTRTLGRRLAQMILDKLKQTQTQADFAVAQMRANQLELEKIIEQILNA